MKIEITFVPLYGGNARDNAVTIARENHPHSRHRQTKPIGEHHKIIPVTNKGYNYPDHRRSAVVWNCDAKFTDKVYFGPFTMLKNKKVMYTCDQCRCLIECPCMNCKGEQVNKIPRYDNFEDHLWYHHVAHGTCIFCLELLRIFPAYNYTRLVSIGPFYSPKYELHKTYVFTHCYMIDGSKQSKLKCDSCDKVFQKVSNKKRHFLKVHYEAVLFCDICGKGFNREDTLLNHKSLVHSSEKLVFSCENCDSTFSLKKNLNQHMRKFHSLKVTMLPCQDCDLTFNMYKDLQKHRKKEHKKFQCNFCSKKFSTNFNLNVHLKTKISCTVCEQIFCTKMELKTHENSSHIILKCSDCEKIFSKRQWLERHIRKKVVSLCDQCCMKFCNERAKLEHVNQVHQVKKM